MRRVLGWLVLLRAVAWAGPTGLNIIPTADLIPWRQMSLALQNGNTAIEGHGSVVSRPTLVPQIQFGLPKNVEAGLDVVPENPPHDYRPVMNLKWTFLPEGYRRPAVAVGASQLGVGFQPTFFLVGSRTLNFEKIQYQKFRAHHRNIKLRGIRAHAGMLRTANAWRAILGTDIEVSDHFVIYADWTSGRHDSVSLGGVLVINRENSITASLLRANNQDRVGGVLLTLTHTFAW